MTHSPPIPAGNTSPYPLHEPPHAHAKPPQTAAPENISNAQDIKHSQRGLGIAVALALGVTFAGLWFANRSRATLDKSALQTKTKKASARSKRTVAD